MSPHSIYLKLTNHGLQACHGAYESEVTSRIKAIVCIIVQEGVKQHEPTFAAVPALYEERDRVPIPHEM